MKRLLLVMILVIGMASCYSSKDYWEELRGKYDEVYVWDYSSRMFVCVKDGKIYSVNGGWVFEELESKELSYLKKGGK